LFDLSLSYSILSMRWLQILFSSLRLSQTSRRHKTIKKCKLILTCPSLSLSLRVTGLSVILFFFPFLSVLVVSFCPYLSLSIYLSIHLCTLSISVFFYMPFTLFQNTILFISWLSHLSIFLFLWLCHYLSSFPGSFSLSLLHIYLCVCVCYSSSRLPVCLSFSQSILLFVSYFNFSSFLRVSHVRQYRNSLAVFFLKG